MVVSIFIIVVVYFYTLPNTIYGGDAGDLVSAIITGGFPHPPGYSLYTLLGRLFIAFPISLSPAGKVALLSLIPHLVSFILLYLILKEIHREKFQRTLGYITVLTLASIYVIWLYSILTEVFALNTAIVLSILFFALKYYRTNKLRYIAFISLFIGFGITHHHTFILILPTVIILIWHKEIGKRIVKNSVPLGIYFVVGLLPLTSLYFAAKSNAELIWRQTDNIRDIVALILRQDYGTFVAGPGITHIWEHRILQIKNLFRFTMADFSVAGFLLILLGLVAMVRTKEIPQRITTSIMVAIIFFGPIFFFYANFPLADTFDFATMERFLIIVYFLLAIPFYFGLIILTRLLNLFTKGYLSNKFLQSITARAIVILLLFIPLGTAFRSSKVIIPLKNDRTAENLGNDVLMNTPPNSIIIASFDTVLFNTQYVYFVQKYAGSDPKRIIIHGSKLNYSYYFDSLKKHYPQLNIPKNAAFSQFLKGNIEKFPIYSNSKYPLPGMNDYEWIPQGLLFKLERKEQSNDSGYVKKLNSFWKNSLNAKLIQEVKNNPSKWRNYYLADILRIYSIAHQNSAHLLILQNQLDDAYRHINAATTLYPDDSDNYYLLAVYFKNRKECKVSENTLRKIIVKENDPLYYELLSEIGEKCYQDEKNKSRIKKELRKLKDIRIETLD
ncbi:DUF2723 domain-containing protein [Candidatus Roizmanbacteria bacterium]|nr:DUF2723 domain-containing protein [Candidatus Roizmanbacteria bacterium]